MACVRVPYAPRAFGAGTRIANVRALVSQAANRLPGSSGLGHPHGLVRGHLLHKGCAGITVDQQWRWHDGPFQSRERGVNTMIRPWLTGESTASDPSGCTV